MEALTTSAQQGVGPELRGRPLLQRARFHAQGLDQLRPPVIDRRPGPSQPVNEGVHHRTLAVGQLELHLPEAQPVLAATVDGNGVIVELAQGGPAASCSTNRCRVVSSSATTPNVAWRTMPRTRLEGLVRDVGLAVPARRSRCDRAWPSPGRSGA